MVSRRVSEIPYSGIRRFFELVSQSKGIVSLGVGEPDFPTPDPLKWGAVSAIESDYTSYTSNWGLIELRERIAEKLLRENKVRVDPEDEVLVTSGTSEALDLVFRALLNPGDEVLVPEPSYVSYKPCVWFSYGKPVGVPVREENEFELTAEDVEEKISGKTRALIVASPNNPTGSVIKPEALREIAQVAVDHDLWVVSDELYEDLMYDGRRHVSLASLPGMRERTITINGFSKGFAFTGWRLGYAAGPNEVVEAMMKIHQYTMLCAPTISQYAALESFKAKKHVKEMVREYDARRRLLVKGLNELPGIECITPKGAFYTFPSIKETGKTSEKYAEELLKKAKVAVVPGQTFGPAGEGHIRCSYSVSKDTINEALTRMKKHQQK
ncbi:MAG: aminotransferase class I/II-fold pyridoxal phosphate-dependent enzyme [Candidatus Altiarchaeales archaeon]|nr:aminotransferase class I/II-fold pyridoxal phosphate-dependent enzyme [Candidatus Altiarchaeales archaeon]